MCDFGVWKGVILILLGNLNARLSPTNGIPTRLLHSVHLDISKVYIPGAEKLKIIYIYLAALHSSWSVSKHA